MTVVSKEVTPPKYGRRLLPRVLDDEAISNPERPFAAIPRSEDLAHGFRDVTFGQVANAVNHIAFRLQTNLGPLKHDFETLTYVGIPDLRYNLVFYAAVKCGYKVSFSLCSYCRISRSADVMRKVFLPSPRNPLATNLALMDQTKSTRLLYAKEMEPMIRALSASEPELYHEVVESLDELLGAPSSVFNFHSTFEEAVTNPILVLHSSGSTGQPKPVVMTHGTFAVMDNDRNFPTVPGRKNHDLTMWDFDGTAGRIYEPFPYFHLAGFFNKVMVPLFTQAIPVFGPPSRPPSGALAAEILRQQSVRGCVLPPSVAEQMLLEPDGIDIFKSLDMFCYAGGPLSFAAGNAISKVTKLCQFYGSTEMGQIRQLLPVQEDWSYMQFHPYANIKFEPVNDGAFELIVFADASTWDSSTLNHNYPGVSVWHTKDLFKPHPTKPDLWRFHGRVDDIIVLSNSEKIYPIPMESHLQGLPYISGALVTGQGRFQPALLLEIESSGYANADGISDKIWREVETANAIMPSHGRIVRSMIIIAKSEKPFVRAGKGTIVRKLTEAAYNTELDELYAGNRHTFPLRYAQLVATAFKSASVERLIRCILPIAIEVDKLQDTDNLYLSGLDSLKSIEALMSLKASLLPHRSASELEWLTLETLYNNPSIGQLSRIVLAFLNDGVIPHGRDRMATMADTLKSLSAALDHSDKHPAPQLRNDDLCIVLTGSTGTLGAQVLKEYLANPNISKVYCLNRSTAAQQKWLEHQAESRSDLPSSSCEVEFLTVDFARSDLGLDATQYASLVADCDLIVHTAWKVDFNQDLSSFAGILQGVRTIIDWSISSSRKPRVVFVSSISSVGSWNPPSEGEEVPEGPIEDLGVALSLGYSESKEVAERLLDYAANHAAVPVSILRVGQIGGATGSRSAKWTQREFIPSLLKTSKSMGLIPNDLQPIDWVPVDLVAKIVTEISLANLNQPTKSPAYYNVVNPRPVPWQLALDLVIQSCGREMQAVPLSTWVQKLQTFDPSDMHELASKPALKLLKFFSLLSSRRGPPAKYSTTSAVQASETLARLGPVDESMMRTWLDQCL